MSRRRIKWLAYNALMTPFIPIRIVLFAIMRLGEAAEWVGLRMPGWRQYDGWG